MCLFSGGLCHTIISVFIIGLLSNFQLKATEGLLEVTKSSTDDVNLGLKGFSGFRKVKETTLIEKQRTPKKYQSDEDFAKQKIRSVSPRFINPANPFGIFGTPSCQHLGFEGSCKELVQCWALGGQVGPLCRRFTGVCCRFFRSCDQRSSQEVVYFSNNKFDGSIPADQPPKSRNRFADPPPECTFQVVTRNRNYCGVRIEPSIDASLVDPQTSQDGTINHETCADSVLSIVGLGDRLDLSLCNQRDAFEKRRYELNITGVRDFKLKVSTFGRAGSPVDVKIRQIKCEEFTGEDLSGTIIPGETSGGVTAGGGTSGGGTSGGGTSGGGTSGVGTSGGTSGGGTTDSGSGVTTESGGVQPPAPPIPVTEEPPSPPAPPIPVTDPPGPPAPIPPPGPNYASCGIKGPGRRSKSKDELLHIIENLEDALKNPEDGPKGPPIRSFSNLEVIYGPEDSLEQKQEDPLPSWDVPSNNETLFSYLMGEPSLLSTRITNGLETRPNEFPWQVAIFKSDNKFHCGASIIGDFYVLTAGHCVINFQNSPQSLVLRLGEWSLSSNTGGAHVNAQIARITVHPDYSRTNLQNDVAVLKLKQRIDFSEKMRPVCLPKSDISLTGELATITGWGKNERGSLVDKMTKLTAVILDNNDCSSKWGGSGFIKPSMMCMDSQIGDSCNGDSGGPSAIEYPTNSGKFFQVGIVSFGSGSCTDKNLPGVYTRVGYFRDWIIRQMI